MKTLLRTLFIAGLLVFTLSAPLRAQIPATLFFLNVQGITGESQQTGHKGEIDVFAFKLGVNQRGISDFGGGAGAGRSQFQPMVIYKNVDTSSPALFLACATGKPIPKVELKGKKGEEIYIKITLSDVLVSSFNVEQPDSDETAATLESVSLSFSKIEISYIPRNPEGGPGAPVTVGFDVRTNRKL
jgi:type VI secretion system secreted protein Hcp